MKTIQLSAGQYLKQIDLGYYTAIKCKSVFEKIVQHNLCGRSEVLLVQLT